MAWIGDDAPCAQTTSPGRLSLLAAEGPLASQLNTGTGNWQARRVDGWSFLPGPPPDFVGRQQTIDARESHRAKGVAAGCCVAAARTAMVFGLMRTGWRLHPSPLPDQMLEPLSLGVVRAVVEGDSPEPLVIRPQHSENPEADKWLRLADGKGEVVVPPESEVSVLFDLGNYCTAYPRMTLSGGQDTSVRIAWAESLYEVGTDGKVSRTKGSRDEVVNKAFQGMADTFIAAGGEQMFRTWWWRAGRYVLLTVRTASEPLTIMRFDVLQTRYPLEDAGTFTSSDKKLNRTQGLLVRGMQACRPRNLHGLSLLRAIDVRGRHARGAIDHVRHDSRHPAAEAGNRVVRLVRIAVGHGGGALSQSHPAVVADVRADLGRHDSRLYLLAR